MLAALSQNVVVSEAPILDDVLRIHRWNPQTTDASRIELFRGAIAALGANATSDQRLFIKLDCWHLFELELIESAFPGIPKYFLFRNPLEVVVSLLRQPSLTLLPNIIPSHYVADSCRTPGSPEYSLAAYAAAGQGAFYRFATAHRETLIPIDYRQLPQFVWESLPRMAFSPEECAALKEASQFNSKNPQSRFSADSAEKQQSASAEIRHYVTQLADPFYFEWLDQIHANPGEPSTV